MTARVRRFAELAAAGFATIAFLLIAGPRIGIDPFDESIYLQGARWAGINAFLGSQAWAPLYMFWYRMIGWVVPHPEPRYFVCWALDAAVLALLPVLMEIPGAWIYTCLLVTLPVMLPVPYVSLFAGWPLLLGLCLLLRRREQRNAYSGIFCLVCVACFIAAFSRPEYQDGVILSALLTVVALALERDFTKKTLKAVLMSVAVLTLAYSIHEAASHSAGNRSGFAFLDSVNLRASDKGILAPGENPWTSTYAQRQFGLDQNLRAPHAIHPIGAYFRANPKLFLLHIVDNLADPRTLGLLALLLGVTAWAWLRKDQSLRQANIYLLAMSVAPVAGILLIYPREHYAMSMAPCLLLFAVQVARPQRWLTPTAPKILAFVSVLFLCSLVSVWRLGKGPFPDQRMHLLRLQCMQEVDPGVSPHLNMVFDSTHGVGQYALVFRLPNYTEEVGSWENFKKWSAETRPGWISVNAVTETVYGVTPAQFDDYVIHTLGYTPHPCTNGADIRFFANNQR